MESGNGITSLSANIQERKYHHVVDIPSDIDIASGRSTYRNGILEVVFRK